MIPQCKGKDLSKVPKSKLLTTEWFASTKFDGHYVQIHKVGDAVRFFTSGGKEFYIAEIAEQLISYNENDFILECEYIGTSEGKLGDRTKVGKLTTYRTMFEKGQAVALDSREIFIAFDIIIEGVKFQDRLDMLLDLKLPSNIRKALHRLPWDLESCKSYAKEIVEEGFEGIFLKHKDHMYLPGKRVNTAVKLKLRPTADLLCIDIIGGEGKYHGKIGSLVLQDSAGRVVAVGSGLSDKDRELSYPSFIGKIIEIEYEQILDTYIQPTFVRVREDKLTSD